MRALLLAVLVLVAPLGGCGEPPRDDGSDLTDGDGSEPRGPERAPPVPPTTPP